MSDLAPVQLLAVGFGPDANFEGRIMAELAELEQAGTVPAACRWARASSRLRRSLSSPPS